MTQRVAIYARYSSDLQSSASIEDQIRLCGEKTQSEGWQIVNCYTDAGISGASLLRPGIQSLMQAARMGSLIFYWPKRLIVSRVIRKISLACSNVWSFLA